MKVILLFLVYGVLGDEIRPKEELVTPYPRYKFEGVDMEEMPATYRDLEFDCVGYYLRCLRHTPLFEICVFNIYQRQFAEFLNECLLELVNCYRRMWYNEGIMGKFPFVYGHQSVSTYMILFYNGDGKKCKYFTRRSSNMQDMMRLYFPGNLVNRFLRSMTEEQLRAPPTYSANTTTSAMDGVRLAKEIARQGLRQPAQDALRIGSAPPRQQFPRAARVAKRLDSRKPDLFDVSLNFFHRNLTGY